MNLLLNSIAHFLVDAVSVSTLFSSDAVGEALTAAVVLYNTLAFSTQCIVGLLVDRMKNILRLDWMAMALVGLGFILPLPFMVKVCVVGLGNSLFHVAAGTITLNESRGNANRLGIFVAPGAFGVTLGTCFPELGIWLCLALVLCAILLLRSEAKFKPYAQVKQIETAGGFPIGVIVLLTAAVAVRAIGGSAAGFSWKSGTAGAFLMTAFVFLGKFFGGFLCDRIGVKKTALISIPAAAVCIAFLSDYAVPSLLGQFLLNLTMPVTLWLLWRAMPDAPAFSFGLAASALWPGTIAGMLFQLTGPAKWICILLSFLFAMAAVLFSAKSLQFKERNESP